MSDHLATDPCPISFVSFIAFDSFVLFISFVAFTHESKGPRAHERERERNQSLQARDSLSCVNGRGGLMVDSHKVAGGPGPGRRQLRLRRPCLLGLQMWRNHPFIKLIAAETDGGENQQQNHPAESAEKIK